MAATFDINDDELRKFTQKLDKLHKVDLPIVIRGTLNDAAFLGRKESIKKFKKEFKIRKQSRKLAPSHILVEKIDKELDINKMVSTIGMKSDKIGKKVSRQEDGADVTGRDVPLKAARVNMSANAPINRALYKKIYKGKPNGVIYKSGMRTIIKTEDRLLMIKSGSKKNKGRVKHKTIWKTLYIFDRNFHLESRPFIAFGAKQSKKKIVKLYHDKANKRFKKRLAK